MAVLYRAVQETLDRPVAVKALKTAVQEDEAFAQRFEREARTLAQLQHENLIHVYEFLREQGALFIVMELVDGSTSMTFWKKCRGCRLRWWRVSAANRARAVVFAHDGCAAS